jgi:hypothetical protein
LDFYLFKSPAIGILLIPFTHCFNADSFAFHHPFSSCFFGRRWASAWCSFWSISGLLLLGWLVEEYRSWRGWRGTSNLQQLGFCSFHSLIVLMQTRLPFTIRSAVDSLCSFWSISGLLLLGWLVEEYRSWRGWRGNRRNESKSSLHVKPSLYTQIRPNRPHTKP